MLVGVVSDTHNNVRNIKNLINIFNNEKVDLVIHTGDITSASSLNLFKSLNCPMMGVYGNNDRQEEGLHESCEENKFQFSEPPFLIQLDGKKLAIFHEPDEIDSFLKSNQEIDLVLHGHTHRYRQELIKGTVFFNPGESAGLMEGKNAIGIINLSNLKIKRIFF